MPVPWLSVLDAVMNVADLALSRRRGRPSESGESVALEAGAARGGLETRLAGVVVAALKEAFDRDTRRLDLEREQLEAERLRAERALKMEMLRQAGEREIGRLRLVAGGALATWVATLFLASHASAAGLAARLTLGAGWLFLLAAVAAAFAAQSTISAALVRADDYTRPGDLSPGAAGTFAPWLVVIGLMLVGTSALI